MNGPVCWPKTNRRGPTSRHGMIERPVRIATKSARRTRAISMSATVDHGPSRLRNRRSQKSNFGVNGGRQRQGIAAEAASGTPKRKADESAVRSFDKAISGLEVAHLLHRCPCRNTLSGAVLPETSQWGLPCRLRRWWLAPWKELTCSIGR
jgi:hypothetical protein